MSLGRRLGRLAQGFVSNINDERLKETIRAGRERGETLKDAFGAAWRGAAEEWRAAEEGYTGEQQTSENHTYGWSTSSTRYAPRKYPPEVLSAYHRLGLGAGAGPEEVRKKRRELVKRYHPDRFVDPEQRKRAERLTAKINAAHDVLDRYLLRR